MEVALDGGAVSGNQIRAPGQVMPLPGFRFDSPALEKQINGPKVEKPFLPELVVPITHIFPDAEPKSYLVDLECLIKEVQSGKVIEMSPEMHKLIEQALASQKKETRSAFQWARDMAPALAGYDPKADR